MNLCSKLFAVLALVTLFAGCRAVHDVNVAEVLQLPASTQIYMASNLWYLDPEHIDARNLHKGEFLQIGTPISIEESTSEKLVLRNLNTDHRFTVMYDESWMMLPVEVFLQRYLTDKVLKERFEKVSPEFQKAILEGRVEKGMSRAEVLMAWGYPVTARTPDLKNNTWLYLEEPYKSRRVIFVDECVSEIFDLK